MQGTVGRGVHQALQQSLQQESTWGTLCRKGPEGSGILTRPWGVFYCAHPNVQMSCKNPRVTVEAGEAYVALTCTLHHN